MKSQRPIIAPEVTVEQVLEAQEIGQIHNLVSIDSSSDSSESTGLLDRLGRPDAEMERVEDAIATAQEACDLAQKNGETALLQRNQELLARYEAHQTAE